jgi:hypothetical protein
MKAVTVEPRVEKYQRVPARKPIEVIWHPQVANIPAAITCPDVMAEKHPELVVAFMKTISTCGSGRRRSSSRRRRRGCWSSSGTKTTTAKLPSATELLAVSRRIG